MLLLSTIDQNPPVRLSCGHAISRDAMKRLVNGHSGRYYHPKSCLIVCIMILCVS